MACLFCKIASAELAADVIYEDKELMAFRDINPQAPSHVLLIPKQHIATIDEADSQHEKLLGQMILTAQKIARQEGLSEAGYRLVFNVNRGGGQDVYHIHLHILGGRQMSWPPG